MSRAGFSDAEYEALKERIDAAFRRWTLWLGLRWWQIDVEYVVDRSQFHENGDTPEQTTAMDVDADWTRLKAYVRVNMLAIADMDDEQLGEHVCHELCHVLVNEMRIPPWANAPNEVQWRHLEAEERVVSLLTKAFGWVYNAGTGELNAEDTAE